MPSKPYGIPAAGRPVALWGDAPVARELRTHELGIVLAADHPASWPAQLRALRDDPAGRTALGKRALARFERVYHPEHALARWETVLAGQAPTAT